MQNCTENPIERYLPHRPHVPLSKTDCPSSHRVRRNPFQTRVAPIHSLTVFFPPLNDDINIAAEAFIGQALPVAQNGVGMAAIQMGK